MNALTHFKLRKTILACAIIASIPNIANAATATSKQTQSDKEQSDSKAKEVETLEVVGSISKTGTVKFYDTKSTDSVSEEKLKEKAVQKVDDALAYTSGATPAVYGNDERSPWLKMRGAEPSFTLDGMPLYFDGQFTIVPEIYGLEKIEVLKGASSELYGSAKPGGTVNMITKRPKNIPEGDIQLTYGTKNQKGVGGDYSGLITDTVKYRIVGEYRDKDGQQDNTGLAHYYFAPSLTWDINKKTLLTLLTSYQKDNGIPESIFFPAYGSFTSTTSGKKVSRNTYYGDSKFDHLKREVATGGYELRHIFDNGLIFSQNYKFVHQNMDLHLITASYAASDTTYGRYVTAQAGINNTHTLDNRLTKDFELGNWKDTLLGGIDYMNTHMHGNDGKYSANDVDIFNPVSTDVTFISSSPFKLNAYELGIYLQNQIEYNNNVIFNQGVRNSSGNSKGYWGGDFDRNYNKTTYNAGLMYIVNDNIAPYVNYSQAFLPIYGFNKILNKTYDPYTANQWEGGIKYEPEWMNGSLTIAYFNLIAQNSFIQVASGNATQALETRSKGVEIQMNGKLTDNIGIELAYTYTDSETDVENKDTSQTAMIPVHASSAWINYEFGGWLNGLSAGTGLRFIGETKGLDGNGDIVSLPNYLLWDAMIKYQFSKSWSAQVNSTNITDETYLTSCSYSCYWGAERSVVASVNYKF